MSATDVVIYGAGGLAREVAWILETTGTWLEWHDDRTTSHIRVVGHLDDRAEMHGESVNGRPVLGNADWLMDRPGLAVIVAIGKPSIRREIVAKLRLMDVTFPTVHAHGSLVGDHGRVGQGSILFPGTVVTSNVSIGDFVLLNPHVSISHDGVIGNYTSLGPGVNLAGNVHVGDCCDVGTNASAIPGARIGSGVVLGAGACVVQDVPDNVTAVGVPARVISPDDKYGGRS